MNKGGFEFNELNLNGAYYIRNFSTGDNRGGFTKCFEKEIYKMAGIDFQIRETFISISAQNVIRGLHFQLHNPQTKLVSVVSGRVWDVIVDLRLESPTYKQWMSVELSADKHNALLIPKGFAHGFASLENGTLMLYHCEGAYDKETDTGIRFDDPELGITWPIKQGNSIHSPRDLQLMTLKEYEKSPMEL